MDRLLPFSLHYFILKKLKANICNKNELADYCKINFPRVNESSFNTAISHMHSAQIIGFIKDGYGQEGRYQLTSNGIKMLDQIFNEIKQETLEINEINRPKY